MAHLDEVTSAQNDHHNVDIEKVASDKKSPAIEGQEDYDAIDKEKENHGDVRELPNLQRRLKSRHLQMIAIGESYRELLILKNSSL